MLHDGAIDFVMKGLFYDEMDESHGWRQPEISLWTLCLIQGILGALGVHRYAQGMRHGAQGLARREELYWLFRDKRTGVGTCDWICVQLGIDRQWLKGWVFQNRHRLRNHQYRIHKQ
jgi:hypothetical protein